jgi:hypothetical protein
MLLNVLNTSLHGFGHVIEHPKESIFSLFESINHDFISLSFICFLALYGCYMLIMKLLILFFKQKHRRKPLYCHMFTLYTKDHISNAPGRERSYYVVSNKVTLAFNSMLISCVMLFVVACFV